MKKLYLKLFKIISLKEDLPHILRQEDRSSMSQSIENRTPYRCEAMEYMFSIKSEIFYEKWPYKKCIKKLS